MKKEEIEEEIKREFNRLWKENNMKDKIEKAYWDLIFYGKTKIEINNFHLNQRMFHKGTICNGNIVWEKVI